jgi:FKBP-type peptidyl-prolyl cis-trans isomerase 2
MIPVKFFEQFKKFPVVGKEVQFAPFLKAQVKEVTEYMVLLDFIVKDGDRFQEEYGTVEVRVREADIAVTVTPRIGAPFKTMEGEGKIAATDGKTFTVDFNPGTAGKPVVLEIELLSLTRKSVIESMKIPWMEEHDQGLAEAKQAGRPVVMVLYADWCNWCKKLFNESFQDPGIRMLRDRMVWIKVNSDKNKEFKKQYKQEGFPLIVFMEPDGRVAAKIDGYVDAQTLRQSLEKLIERQSKSKT